MGDCRITVSSALARAAQRARP